MSKETAFYPRLQELTDGWMDLFGYWAPTEVTNTAEEYRAVRETAGLMDFTMLRKVDIEGEGAQDFVNTIVTRDVSNLTPGGSPTARSRTRTERWWTTARRCCARRIESAFAAPTTATTRSSPRRRPSGITVREFTDAMPHLCLQGPKSREILQTVANQDLSNEAFPYYTFREDVEIAGIPVFMTRLGYTAELGYELWVDRDRALELWDALLEAGEPGGMKLIGMVALDLFRIEGGFIIGGVEYDPTVSPYECGLGWSVELDKGDFQGREALARDREETRLRLTSVVLERGGDEASGGAIGVDGEEVGLVTQAVESPYLDGQTLGLAKIRKDLKEPGQKIHVQVGDDEVAGEVVEHPVYDKERKRAKES